MSLECDPSPLSDINEPRFLFVQLSYQIINQSFIQHVTEAGHRVTQLCNLNFAVIVVVKYPCCLDKFLYCVGLLNFFIDDSEDLFQLDLVSPLLVESFNVIGHFCFSRIVPEPSQQSSQIVRFNVPCIVFVELLEDSFDIFHKLGILGKSGVLLRFGLAGIVLLVISLHVLQVFCVHLNSVFFVS